MDAPVHIIIGFTDVTKLSFVYWTIDLTQEMNNELIFPV